MFSLHEQNKNYYMKKINQDRIFVYLSYSSTQLIQNFQFLFNSNTKQSVPVPANHGKPRSSLSWDMESSAVTAGGRSGGSQSTANIKAGPWCHRPAISWAGLSLSWSTNSLHIQSIWTLAHAPTQADGTCLGVWKFIFVLPFSISKLASP